MHCAVSAVVVYIRFPALTKLIICPANSKAQFRTTSANIILLYLSIKPTKKLLQPNAWEKYELRK